MESKRSSFTGKIGFVLAAAGSAVGLGNIWRFPYLTAQYGGGIFLLVYILLAITFGFSLMVAEIAIGRKTGKSAIEAYKDLDRRFSFLGYLTAIVPIIILPYYSVIGGWVLKWLFGFAAGQGPEMAADGFFGSYIGLTGQPILWFFLFIGLTALVVLLGVEKGVEKVSKFMMPILVILILGIALYTIFAMDGALEGVRYLFVPDFSKFSVKTVLGAMGQLFYSMSLAMGIMITYGSYMKKDISIPSSARNVAIFDTIVATLASLMVIPAVFAFSGGNQEALTSGPGLMFATLPKVFEAMPGGTIVAIAFFIMVFFAAITSSISLMEAVVSIFCDKFKMKRYPAIFTVLGISLLLGCVSSLGYSAWSGVTVIGMQFLDFFDFISNSVIMPIVAFLTCIMVGYIVKPQAVLEEVELNGKFSWKPVFNVVIKYVAPICIVAILVSSVLSAYGIIKI